MFAVNYNFEILAHIYDNYYVSFPLIHCCESTFIVDTVHTVSKVTMLFAENIE